VCGSFRVRRADLEAIAAGNIKVRSHQAGSNPPSAAKISEFKKGWK
jgi:hypothetical protein